MIQNMHPAKVITGPATRWAYVNVWEPKSVNGSRAKFSVCLMIPKTDTATLEKIDRAIRAAYEEGMAKLCGSGSTVPALADLKLPLRDGDRDRPTDPAFAGYMFINASCTTAPDIVDENCDPILNRAEVHSGVYGRASITLYAYNSNGSRGIACGLNNLQKLRDGEPMGSRSRARDDFAAGEENDFPF